MYRALVLERERGFNTVSFILLIRIPFVLIHPRFNYTCEKKDVTIQINYRGVWSFKHLICCH